MRERLKQRLEQLLPEILAFTEDLVRIPSENPPGRYYEHCAGRIEEELTRLRFRSKRVGECVIGEWGDGRRLLYFHGHYDVVPASRPEQFKPYIEGANLFGRGSSDMKSGLAAMLYAVKALEDCGVPIDGRIALVFVPDEETAGDRGTARLIAENLIDRRALGMLTPEPTSGVVWNGCRGALTLEVTVKGKPAHVSLEHQGVNAFERMIPLAARLLRLKEELRARRSILMLGGVCSSGSNFNLVPGECRFTIDRRLNPDEDVDTERARLEEIFDETRASRTNLEVRVVQQGSASHTPSDGPLALALAESIGGSLRFEPCPGLLETRYYAALGIPAFAYGPGLLAVSHGPHEFVPIRNILHVAEVYASTAGRMLAVTEPHGGN
jgi:acetylornithine deacetylase/succinyl-diaminopimelate desuccinylase family protein